MAAQPHGPLYVSRLIDELFGENTLVVWVAASKQCWVFDPGFPPATDQAADLITHEGLELKAIVLTHGHGDHIAGVEALRQRFPDASLIAPRDDAHMLSDPEANLSAMFGAGITAPQPDQLITGGQTLQLGAVGFGALDVSGHSPGGLAFYCEDAGMVITGDALFAGGIGRTDFPGSNHRQLVDNIHAQLMSLPNETIVYPGHGPCTTIGEERTQNRFLAGS